MATHSFGQIDRALDEFERVGQQVGVLPNAIEHADRAMRPDGGSR